MAENGGLLIDVNQPILDPWGDPVILHDRPSEEQIKTWELTGRDRDPPKGPELKHTDQPTLGCWLIRALAIYKPEKEDQRFLPQRVSKLVGKAVKTNRPYRAGQVALDHLRTAWLAFDKYMSDIALRARTATQPRFDIMPLDNGVFGQVGAALGLGETIADLGEVVEELGAEGKADPG